MASISRYQFSNAKKARVPRGYFPSVKMGINAPNDNDYSPLQLFNNRALTNQAADAVRFQNVAGTGTLPSVDANGWPTTAFSMRIDQAATGSDVIGNWLVKYNAASMPTVGALNYTATITGHTWNSGTGDGSFLISNPGSISMALTFSVGAKVTEVYKPAYNTGVGVPFWNAQFLRTISPYSYIRFMDMTVTNTSYVDPTALTWKSPVEWTDRITPTNYNLNGRGPGQETSRGGLPLEWVLDLANTSSKDAWLNIELNASDNYVDQHTAMVASSGVRAIMEFGNETWNTSPSFNCWHKRGAAALQETLFASGAKLYNNANQRVSSITSDGSTATVVTSLPHGATTGNTVAVLGALSNAFLYGGSVGTLANVQAQGSGTLTVVVNGTTFNSGTINLSGATSFGNAATLIQAGFTAPTFSVAYDSVTGGFKFTTTLATSAATLSYATGTLATGLALTQAAGATYMPSMALLNIAASAGTVLTVVDSTTVTFPTTLPATGRTFTGAQIFGNTGSGFGGGVAMNAGSNLFQGFTTGAYSLGMWWFFRRAWDIAVRQRAAWTAAGRSLADLEIVLPCQATSTYANFWLLLQNFYSAIHPGVALNTVFTSCCVGGYYTPWAANTNFVNAGFGLTGTYATLTDMASVLSQLNDMVTHAYGAEFYNSFAYFCKFNGLKMFCYEAGVDTSGVTTGNGSPTSAVTGATNANADPAMEGITSTWLYGLMQLGFERIGYYNGSSGSFAGSGCFAVGRTPDEMDPTTARVSRAAKLNGILDVIAGPPSTLPITYHAFPITLNAYDCVGNEAVKTTANVWPNFAGTNLPYSYAICPGPLQNGLTYTVWSETNQTVTVTINGHTTGSTVIPVSVQTNGGTVTSFNASAPVGTAASGVTLGSCTTTLQPGMNYVFISVPAAQKGNANPHSIQFS